MTTPHPSYCSDERPCTPCFSNDGKCEDAMSEKHDIIRAWCASCGMPSPSNGECIALAAALASRSPEPSGEADNNDKARHLFDLAEQWADARVQGIRENEWGPWQRETKEALWEACKVLATPQPSTPAPAAQVPSTPTAAEPASAGVAPYVRFTDKWDCQHVYSLASAARYIKAMYDEWPGGLEEIESALRTAALSAPTAAAPTESDVAMVRDQLVPSVWALQAFERILSTKAAPVEAAAPGAAQVEPVAWMPIETAPKDGTRFLAPHPNSDRLDFWHWQEGKGLLTGWRDSFIYVSPEGSGPVCWMPLPPLPSAPHPVSGAPDVGEAG